MVLGLFCHLSAHWKSPVPNARNDLQEDGMLGQEGPSLGSWGPGVLGIRTLSCRGVQPAAQHNIVNVLKTL